jgi:hypothetical protein
VRGFAAIGHCVTDLVTFLTDRNVTGAETPVTLIDRSHQLQPLVLPQLGQAWHEPARIICTPHCMHMGASLARCAGGDAIASRSICAASSVTEGIDLGS